MSFITCTYYDIAQMKTVLTGLKELINGSSCSCERSELSLFTTLDLCHGSVTLTLHESQVFLHVYNQVCSAFHFHSTLTYCRWTIHIKTSTPLSTPSFMYKRIHAHDYAPPRAILHPQEWPWSGLNGPGGVDLIYNASERFSVFIFLLCTAPTFCKYNLCIRG